MHPAFAVPKDHIFQAESEVDKILGMEPVNTTAQHRFHLFDMNCDICTGKKERELSNLQKKEAKERKRIKRMSQVNAFLRIWMLPSLLSLGVLVLRNLLLD